jgi:deoxyribodipyrimidine photo-lyase
VLPLYIVEPEYWQLPDVAPRQYAFLRRALEDLHLSCARLGQPLVVRVGEAVSVLEQLRQETAFNHLWAHEETGNDWTYQRDIRVRRWAREQSINFNELPSNGVVRGPKNRDDWEAIWSRRMRAPQLPAPHALPAIRGVDPGRIPSSEQLKMPPDPVRSLQPGGESMAHSVLESFLRSRGIEYRRALSSLVDSANGCSRLSPYLAYGNLSVRQVVQATRARLREEPDDSPWHRALDLFESRLHWRCHFMQKLESRPSLEFENLVPAYDLLGRRYDEDKFHAWAAGQTGYPLVDASMRALQTTGWLNFRMRALLVSFAAFDLWLPWQDIARHLARLFVDYEPGIHYPQVQMQAGIAGSNTVRIYDPTRQAHENDPEGRFIRQWLPELRAVPLEYLFEPWKMPLNIQRRAGCILGQQYPRALCDHEARQRAAREAITEVRRRDETWDQSREVWTEIGSRHSAEPKRQQGTTRAQKQEAAGQLGLW